MDNDATQARACRTQFRNDEAGAQMVQSSQQDQPPAGLMRRLGASGPVAVALSFLPPLGGFVLLAALTSLGTQLRQYPETGWLGYFVATGLLMGLSLVPTYSCAILAGWAFGFALGCPLAVAAITAASVIAYAIGRGISRDRVLAVIHERPRWNAIHRALLDPQAGRPLLVVMLLRLPPASPFALANFVLAAARVPLPTYLIGTFVGVIPRTALASWAAAELEQLRFENVMQTWMVAAGIAVAVAVCVVLGVLSNRALRSIAPNHPP